MIPTIETDKVEFKTSFSEEVIISLVAFSNAKGGTVYVGVCDDGSIKGVQLQKETTAGWLNEIRTKTVPALIPDVEVLKKSGKTVVAFNIYDYPIKPVSIKGRYYKRVSNANQLLLVSEVVNLHLQSINSSWDAFPDTLHTMDEISLDKVQKTIETMKQHGLTIHEDPLSFLIKYGLIRDDKLTSAAYLLFTKNDSLITTIELGHFQDAITIKDSDRTKSDILTQIEQILAFVRKHINKEVIITGNAQNTERWQYPMEAIREIVINMIIHRDYRSSSDSIVKIFSDKIEFYNPGRLPDNISVEDLLSNTYKSTPRNKTIASFCKDLGLIEKYGSGIHRILEQFKNYNLPAPKFENISDGFQVVVFAAENNTEKDTENNTENNTEKYSLSNNQEKILECISKNNLIKAEELVGVVGINLRNIKENISKLKAKGLLVRVGPDKGGRWEVLR